MRRNHCSSWRTSTSAPQRSHPPSEAPMEVSDRVADRVALQVPYVRLTAGIRQHLQHIAAWCLASGPFNLVAGVRSLVADLPGVLMRPQRLPAGLYLAWVISLLRHRARRLAGGLTGPPGPPSPGCGGLLVLLR